ncbi:hypothetical protein [Actinoalloteichus hymeniacidonis]|uniref:SWIM-type domain-containing protein n=1 Tax=Actinoalloteichus hymeniacidonis TaxID=340345 RepID=A0AAC9HQP9_9PSEU|nr:hypothetical protein [Actinoalloteichus hymeniacidonis]AOS63618.1 hypothetical protein TL08_14020 [Actinoalloteichus hymeniacidonis]MBB5908334.1 putative Zn finger protein [Actinoalloteichus hymeniacidonis]
MIAEYGATVWGKAWLRTVETTSVTTSNALLPRARSLVRNDAVTVLTIGPGLVEAEVLVKSGVQRVRIELAVWAAPVRAEADRLIGAAREQHAGLAAGDLPDSLAEDLRRHAVPVAVPAQEQLVRCSCPARTPRCVHVLACLYALVQRIDEEPVLAVVLRSPGTAVADTPTAPPDRILLADIEVAGFYGG